MRHYLAALLVCIAVPAAACPPAPDIEAEESALLAQVQAAPNEGAAQPLSNRLWELWTKAPDEAAQALLDQGMTARRVGDLLGAQRLFDELVHYCPDYAEGYNQRAFVRFLTGDYAAALPDLERAIERSPRHVGAISGKALTLMGLERGVEAQDVLREAVALNPWLSERHLLVEPEGQEL